MLAYAVPAAGSAKYAPDPQRFPNVLIDRKTTKMTLEGEYLVLHYFGPAHTSGDVIVELPNDDSKPEDRGDVGTAIEQFDCQDCKKQGTGRESE